MQKDDVKSALRFGNAGQQLFEIGIPPEEKQIERAAARIDADRAAPVVLGLEVFAKFRKSSRALIRVREGIGIPVEKRLDDLAEFLEVEVRKIPNDAVRRKNRKAARMRIDKRHHGEFVRAHAIAWRAALAGGGAALVTVIECCFVTMVAVGDQEFLCAHFLLNTLDECRIGYRPEPVRDAEFIAQFERRALASDLFEHYVNLSRASVVEHEELAGLRAGVAEKLDAVRLGSRKRTLVGENDVCGVILNAAQGDESDPCAARPGAGDGGVLRVDVDTRRGVLRKNFL